MRGIVLISLGQPYYIRMAYQLAYSIKCNEDIPIHLLSNNSEYLTEEQRKVFDKITEPPKEAYTKNGEADYLKAKTYLYDLSEFEETIFLDADMVALENLKISELFEKLKDVDFTMANRGREDIKNANDKTSIWGDIPSLVQAYEINEGFWYQLSSEFIYFKKTAKAKEVFDWAKDFYEKPKVAFNKFANGMADEFAFGFACLVTGLYPHVENYTPIFWSSAEKRPPKEIDPYVNEHYYAYSMGGNYATEGQMKFYNNMLKYYQNKSGKKIEVFPAYHKARYIEERKKI